ncbi:MAG: YcbK family protein [Burkholderiales bacterium]
MYPETRAWQRVYGGLTERQEHIFTWMAVVVVLLFVTAWVGAIVTERRHLLEAREIQARTGVAGAPKVGAPASRHVTSALTDPASPRTAYMNEALLRVVDPMRGESGAVRFYPRLPGTEVPGAPRNLTVSDEPGIYKVTETLNQVNRAREQFNFFTLVPRTEKRGGKIGPYYLGSWPFEEGGKPRAPAYAPPSGFIEVTPENQNTYVSENFRLRDFLTKDQGNVWPKYLLLNAKMLDKLELVIQDLESKGIKIEHVQVMSGFRTPKYNHGGGNTAGRANLSRHMYGDAADVFVDNDRNGNMDDLNRDGRVDTRDADVMAQAAERVERKYPSLVGGVGVYKACCGHGPFTHVDVRGTRARWRE